LENVLEKFPSFSEEVYVSLDSKFALGSTLELSHCISGSSLWKLALFPGKDIGIFRTQKARWLGGRNLEVVLLPGKFQVKAWYHQNPICLGQKNVRETAYKISETDNIKNVVIVFEDSK
jgi:hypothetical protein